MDNLKRICCTCKVEKPIFEFSKYKREKSGYTKRCKKCRNEYYKKFYLKHPEKMKNKNLKNKEFRHNFYQSKKGIVSSRKVHLKRKYNLTIEKYNNLLKKQNGVCAICGEEESNFKNKFLSIDHCHKSKKIRGLLCGKCNTGIGFFNDNIEIMNNAIKYLNN